MNKFVNNFDDDIDKMPEGERLFADALTHMLDRHTVDYVELLGDEEVDFCVAAEPAAAYGDE